MTDWTGRTVLVTGGAGFIGSHLVDRLVAEGARVRVLDDFSSGSSANLTNIADSVEIHEAAEGIVGDEEPEQDELELDGKIRFAGAREVRGHERDPLDEEREVDAQGEEGEPTDTRAALASGPRQPERQGHRDRQDDETLLFGFGHGRATLPRSAGRGNRLGQALTDSAAPVCTFQSAL